MANTRIRPPHSAAFLTVAAIITFCAIIITPVGSQKLSDADGITCDLVILLPFTDERSPITSPHDENDSPFTSYGYGQWPDEETLAKASFSLLAAAEMARKHFNERDGSIVPELAPQSAVMAGCDIQLGVGSSQDNSTWVFDSGYSRSKSVDQLLPLVKQPVKSPSSNRSNHSDICSVIGPINPRAHEGISVITENLGVPQLGFATIDRRLERVEDFPTFLRTIPAATDFSAKVATLVGRDVWKREYVAIIYDQSDYGEQFEDPLEDAEDYLGYATVTEHVIEGDDDSIYGSLGEAQEKGFRTILLITNRPAFLNDIARIADELGMLGDNDYFWIISGDAFPSAMRDVMTYEVDSPTDKMLRGAALFTNHDPFIYNGEDDRFLVAWREQDSNLAQRALELQPKNENGELYYTPDVDTYFATETPTEFASFIYDSVIATGIGACQATTSDKPNAHYDGIMASEFHGASGNNFNMLLGANTRDPSNTQYGVYNLRPGPVENNNRRYDAVLTSIWDESYTANARGEEVVDGGAWRNVEGAQFVFYDGTTNEPMPLRTMADAHMLSDGIQIFGLFTSALSMFLCMATGAFVATKRKHKHIKSSQPEFDLILCFGATLFAASLIFVSFDESDGFSEEKLTAMCMTWPWFAAVGYLTIFCALFSKLWRLSKVMSFRRQQVKKMQVVAPFALIILCSLVAVSLWTAIDPLVWLRKTISGMDDEGNKNSDEPLETYGYCGCENGGALYFGVPLGILGVLAIGITAVFSWKLKNVSTDFADSKLIFFGIITHIQVWAVGGPILYVTRHVSRDAFYMMLCAITTILSLSMVTLVIWPKVYLYFRDEYFGGPPKRSAASTIGVGTRRGNVRVSGMQISPETSRIIELESEVRSLRDQLARRDSERSDLMPQVGVG